MLNIHLNMVPIFEFNDAQSIATWRIVNDGVMGGLSSSQIEWTDGHMAVFKGIVSLENYGGFASVRTLVKDVDLKERKSIQMRILGDGKTYKFRIRTNQSFDGVAYSVNFDTVNGEWQELILPFENFQPTFRGRRVSGMGPLRGEDIRQIGFLIGDKQEGAFNLMVDWIKAL